MTGGASEDSGARPRLCLPGTEWAPFSSLQSPGLLDSQVQQQRQHHHHRTLPHPPPSSTHSGPRELLVLLLICLRPDSGHFLRPFPTASPEDPSLSPSSELLPPLSQLALSDSVSAGLDRQCGLWTLYSGCPPISFSAQSLSSDSTPRTLKACSNRGPLVFPSQITGTFGQVPKNPVIVSEVVLPGTDVLNSSLTTAALLTLGYRVGRLAAIKPQEEVDVVSSAVFADPREAQHGGFPAHSHPAPTISGCVFPSSAMTASTLQPAAQQFILVLGAVSVLMRLFSQHHWSSQLFPAVA
ncbi:hypothetical protein Landi51_00273 [Colletotrichum acutatum]